MSTLEFPKASKEAAMFWLKKWGHQDKGLEDIAAIESDLFNEVGNFSTSYGVEQAILQNTQVRLLHEIDLKDARLNCAEVAISLMQFYAAAGFGDTARLMRFSDGRESDHFSLLHFDNGFDSDPFIVDPLFGKFGRVRFLKEGKGLIYTPLNLLPENYKGAPPRSDRANGDWVEHLKYTNIELLTIDEVMRYVNFLNTEAGFFAYYETRQKIREDKHGGFNVEYTVKTEGDALQIQAVFADNLFDLFTFEKTYRFEDGEMHDSTDFLIHLGYNWSPKRIVFSAKDGVNPDVNTPDLSQQEQNIGVLFTEFCKRRIERDKVYTKNQLNGYMMDMVLNFQNEIRSMLNDIGVSIEDLLPLAKEGKSQDWKQCIANELNAYQRKLSGAEDEQFSRRIARIDYNTSFLKYVLGLEKKHRTLHVDCLLFQKDFRERRIIPKNPYGKLPAGKETEEFLLSYAGHRYGMFKPTIDQFFESDVVTKLVDRYASIMSLRETLRKAS